jgi:hypothetical protein
MIGVCEGVSVMSCPAESATRLNRLAIDRPGAHEVYKTRKQAMNAADGRFMPSPHIWLSAFQQNDD